MSLVIDVVAEGEDRPPPGASVRVEVRDVTLQDTSAVTLAACEDEVTTDVPADDPVATVELDVGPHRGGDRTVWVHIDATGSGRVSKGDYITMQSFPVPTSGEGRLTVAVKRV